MLGKLSKYSFLLALISGYTTLFFDLGVKGILVAFFCLLVSVLSFLGWLIDGPIVVVVKDDKDR